MTKELEFIQNYLKQNQIDGYIVFSNDDHGSEYVVDHFKARAFLSGFTGSAGTLLITQDASYCWTDGRYFLQAADQLKSTGTKLMKMGIDEDLISFVKGYKKIAFDFSLATVSFVKQLKSQLRNIEIVDVRDLIDQVWTDREPVPATKAYRIPTDDAGESVFSKIERTLEAVNNCGCEYALISSLDDIAWVLNLRGNDIPCNPVNYAYLLLSHQDSRLYIDSSKLDEYNQDKLNGLNIQIKSYDDVYADVAQIEQNVLIDEDKTNYALFNCLKNKYKTSVFPTTIFKAVKNETEIENMKKAHIEDAVAMIRFMKWVKENAGKIQMDELSVQQKLYELRAEGKNFLDLSFGTICGYGSNGAVIHYSASEKTNKKITDKSLLLVDSGGQYKYGTTDITRTFVLGELTSQEKKDFTLVLKSHIALGSAIFPKGTTGYGLDMIARDPLFREFVDYNHGTGHGIGYLLNVHEGPQSINMRTVTRMGLVELQPGMIISNEPGIYRAGSHGVRHESLVLCVKKQKNEFNNFYGFETITYVPIDLDGIDVSLLTKNELEWINEYHQMVYGTMVSYLDEEHQQFLREITRKI